MSTRTLAASLWAVAVLAIGASAAAQTAQEIMTDAIERNSTGFQQGAVSLTLSSEDKAGVQKTRRLTARSKRGPEGLRTQVRLLAPDELKGQSFLFKEVKDGEDLVYWYLPSFGVTRRVQGEGKKGAFMGTDLTYADLESRDLKDATWRRLPDEAIGPHEVFVIEATPKPGADTDYGQIIAYIRKSDRATLKLRFFGVNKKEVKVLFVEKLDQQGPRSYVKQMTIRPTDGGYTRVVIDAIDFDQEIPDVVFTPEALANE